MLCHSQKHALRQLHPAVAHGTGTCVQHLMHCAGCRSKVPIMTSKALLLSKKLREFGPNPVETQVCCASIERSPFHVDYANMLAEG